MHICTRKTVKTACNKEDFVAQLVEQLTLNQWAVGSSPTEVTEDKPLTFVSGFLFSVEPAHLKKEVEQPWFLVKKIIFVTILSHIYL